MRTNVGRAAWILAASAVVLVPRPAEATREDAYEISTRILGVPGTGIPLGDLEPAFHHSFVRNNSLSILSDTTYAAQLKAANYSSVDVVMQQCFGGGFLNDVSGQLNDFTFASASGWWESAKNLDLPIAGAGGGLANLPRTVDNFTRAWRETSAAFNGAGPIAQANLLDNFQAARKGLPILPGGVISNYNVRQDPWAPGGNTIGVEYPQYNSSGAGADGRNLGNEDYAILVAWDLPDARHGINIRRMYDTLTNVYGIPAAHIAVLYPGALPATIPIEPTDLSGLPNTPVSAMNRDANVLGVNVPNFDWAAALSGLYFGPGGPPTSASHLLVYNTGHGGHAVTLPFAGTFNVGTDEKGKWVLTRLNGFDYVGDIIGDVSLTDPATMMDDVQISFSQFMDPGLQLFMNGTLIGSLGAADGTLPLDPFVTDPVYSYSFQVPHALIGSMTDVDLEIEGPLGSFSLDPSLLRAVDLRGGDQEYLAVNEVPEPSVLIGLAPWAIAGMAGRRRRKRA